ncbi:MAG: ThiF family adenylyltransferase, partial [Oscillospiraceae bacterium]|nr:ThiF family adenylyltransferase [Oscillospiraceae bacterium]
MQADWLSRERALIGDDAVEKLRNASVAVFGLGGVGGAAVEGLARAGIGNITVIDH